MRSTVTAFAIIAAVLTIAAPASAGDWPQWRGPHFNGSSDETSLPATLDLEADVAWKAPLPGPSGATAVIANGRVFVSSTIDRSPQFVAICLDEKTGKQLWSRQVGSNSTRFPRNNMASPSPVAGDDFVVFSYGSGDIVAFDYAGNQLWSRNLETEYGNLALQFGYSNSPLLIDGKLFVIVIRRDHPYRKPDADGPLESFVMAIDPKTGRNIWKQTRPTNVFDEAFETYSTPMPFERQGRLEILNIGADFITANDPQTGRELWRYEYWTSKVRDSRIIPTLVTSGDIIFGTRHKNKGLFALTPPKAEQPAKVLWEYTDAAPDCSTPLLYQGRLYVLDGMKNGKVVTCMDPQTGEQFFQGKIGGRGPWRASLTAGDGKLYCINESGEIVVLKAGQTFEILYETKTQETPIQASIAIANSNVYIRTAESLYCMGK